MASTLSGTQNTDGRIAPRFVDAACFSTPRHDIQGYGFVPGQYVSFFKERCLQACLLDLGSCCACNELCVFVGYVCSNMPRVGTRQSPKQELM